MTHLILWPLTTSMSGFLERRIALFRADGVLELAVDGIVFHLVGEIIRVGGNVHDGNDIN